MFSYTYRARGTGAALQVQLVTQVRCFFWKHWNGQSKTCTFCKHSYCEITNLCLWKLCGPVTVELMLMVLLGWHDLMALASIAVFALEPWIGEAKRAEFCNLSQLVWPVQRAQYSRQASGHCGGTYGDARKWEWFSFQMGWCLNNVNDVSLRFETCHEVPSQLMNDHQVMVRPDTPRSAL